MVVTGWMGEGMFGPGMSARDKKSDGPSDEAENIAYGRCESEGDDYHQGIRLAVGELQQCEQEAFAHAQTCGRPRGEEANDPG